MPVTMPSEAIECSLRVLWALVERAGGTVTISEHEAGPVSGSIKVIWENGSITLSIGADASALEQ